MNRFEAILSSQGFVFEPPLFPATAERAVVMPDVGLTLRRMGPDETRFDPSGLYRETRVVMPNWRADGIRDLFSFLADERLEPDFTGIAGAEASVGYQLSNDGGASFLFWKDGPDQWLPAVGPDVDTFNDRDTVDRRIPLFPLVGSSKQVRVRVKMTPGHGGLQRPILRAYRIFNVHRMDFYEDIGRSIKRHIEANVRVPLTFNAELAAAAGFVDIPDMPDEPGLGPTVVGDVEVFNLTSDPGRMTNLFAGLAGRTITFTSPQIGQVEIRYVGTPKIYIGAEDFFYVAQVPSIVIFVPRDEQAKQFKVIDPPERERSIARREGRLQPRNTYMYAYPEIRCQGALQAQSRRMMDEVSVILDRGDTFRSVASGEGYNVYENIQGATEDRVGEGLWVTTLRLHVFGKWWMKPPGPPSRLVDVLDLMFTSQFQCNLNLPEPLRRRWVEEFEITGDAP